MLKLIIVCYIRIFDRIGDTGWTSNIKKGKELVDPDRTIELRYEDGTWNVVNEGY